MFSREWVLQLAPEPQISSYLYMSLWHTEISLLQLQIQIIEPSSLAATWPQSSRLFMLMGQFPYSLEFVSFTILLFQSLVLVLQ